MISNKKLDSPINNLQQLMCITAEECGELTQVCMKIMRKYDSLEEVHADKFSDILTEEAGDVLYMLQLLVQHNVINETDLQKSAAKKAAKLKKWSTLFESE